MYLSAPLLLSFVASALAYTVTVPSSADGWSSTGPQTLSWDRVSTDPGTFAVVLVNTDGQVDQVLNAQVDGDLKTISVNPPSGGWPQGGGFRVNLVKDVNHVNTILAQSDTYSIGNTTPSSAASATATAPVSSTARPTTVPATIPATLSVTGTSTGTPATLAVSSSSSRPLTTSSAPATSNTPLQNSGYKAGITYAGLAPLLVALAYSL
ncbi:hypothetical protein C0991_012092 [Blastosporella zonata]|nr:hypothetical protein C0991_012092 [Blastosporella zonata]